MRNLSASVGLVELLPVDELAPVIAHLLEVHRDLCLKMTLAYLEGLCGIGANAVDAEAQRQGAGALHFPRGAPEAKPC